MILNIKNYKTSLILGVYDFEKTRKTEILISLKIQFDATRAAKTDNLADTIDYDKIIAIIEETSSKKDYNLIEALIKDLKDNLEQKIKEIEKLSIKIIKTGIIPKAEEVSIEG